MRIRFCVLFLLLSNPFWIATAQSISNAGAAAPTPQQASGASVGYADTVHAIKTWLESEKNDDLSRVLRIGNSRTGDLAKACQSSDQDVAAAAFFSLQLLGKPECQSCLDSVSQAHDGAPLTCSDNMDDRGFQRIENWLATKRTGAKYECGEDYDSLTPITDSVLYALILDGSSRSRSLLDSMLAFSKACDSGDTIIGEVLEQAESLILSARKIGHNLVVEPGKLESSIRASAFFLDEEYRKDSKVEVIDRNGNRILLEVSYHCGMLCGRGYYVVLRKDGADWHYAMIQMAWIS
jgi:hypothetical protein